MSHVLCHLDNLLEIFCPWETTYIFSKLPVLFSHTATVTKDVLLQLFSHSMELKIWDTKDKVSPRARFDRPKAFRLPASRGPEESESSSTGGVQQLVLSQQESFENNQPKDSRIFAGNQVS